ncbi:hypothetical protein HAX54_041785, partial [Datura stramonium]|nr:hypothetical protein [Datura stramonium]
CHGIKRSQKKGSGDPNKGLKWLQKGTKGSSSSAAKGTPARRFKAKVVEPDVLNWFNAQKKAKYAPETWIGE